jgi:hypothetical protein
MEGFSPCGVFFALVAWEQAFFRSLFSPYIKPAKSAGLYRLRKNPMF